MKREKVSTLDLADVWAVVDDVFVCAQLLAFASLMFLGYSLPRYFTRKRT